MVGRGGPPRVITVLVPRPVPLGHTVELDADEAHHLRVRRAAETRVALRDGTGFVGEGILVTTGRRASVTVDQAATLPEPAPLVLAVGAGDRERFALLVVKSAELGVTRVVPLETERSKSVAGRLRDDQLLRLRRRALEAVKQSGAAWAPRVSDPVSLERFLSEAAPGAGAGAWWLADGEGAPPPAVLAPDLPVTVVIGPEGGLTEDERGAAVAAGCVAVGLGPHILRFETAAIASAVTVHIARRRGAE